MEWLTADFETITDPDDCRIWAWATCDILDPEKLNFGNTMEGFIDFISKRKATVFFHNLKFDGDFILNYILKNGYKLNKDGRNLGDKEFTTLISDKINMFYSMNVCFSTFPKRIEVEFRDSAKLINRKVSEIAEMYHLEEQKLEIDYDEYREPGHELTDLEIAYIKNDVVIMAKALKTFLDDKRTKLTIGSNALHMFREMMGKRDFERFFPVLEYDVHNDLKQAYKGGYTYANERFANQEIGEGIVLDVNSLYPWSMHSPNLLPYGAPKFFDGKYKKDKLRPLYIQRITCQFELKEGYLPTIQIKNGYGGFCPTEYLSSSDGKLTCLTLTNFDLELFLKHYNVSELTYVCGWSFKAHAGFFDEYIDYWTKQKIKATIEGNYGLRALAKLFLNALYGKFATSPEVCNKWPELDDDGKVIYVKGEPSLRKPIYMPVGEFVTSIARCKTITSAQKCFDRFLYADTDSLHLTGLDYPEGLEVDDVKLGAWAHEGTFTRARYLRAKAYIEDMIVSEKDYKKELEKHPNLCRIEGGKFHVINVTCAGMPENLYSQVTWDNFNLGSVFTGKLKPVHVPGGTVLVPGPFQIRKKTVKQLDKTPKRKYNRRRREPDIVV